MNSPPRPIVMLTMLALSGCAEFAYKTGAGTDALAADKAACKQTAAYETCMHDKGWTIADLGSDTPPAPITAPVATNVQPSAPGTASVVTPAAASAPAETAPAPADPMSPVKTTAWVKFGAGSPHDDIEACVALLGPDNAPNTVNKTVTRALLACMRGKGWRAL